LAVLVGAIGKNSLSTTWIMVAIRSTCLVDEDASAPFPRESSELQRGVLVTWRNVGIADFYGRIFGLIYRTYKGLLLLVSQPNRKGRNYWTTTHYSLSLFGVVGKFL
jgi:hypothetical protein